MDGKKGNERRFALDVIRMSSDGGYGGYFVEWKLYQSMCKLEYKYDGIQTPCLKKHQITITIVSTAFKQKFSRSRHSNAKMVATIRQYKAACVQAEPGWFDLEKCIQKTVSFILEAGEKGCKLIAFPEVCKSISRE